MSYKEIAKEILEIEISALQKLIEQDLTDFDNIIELMLNCKGKIIVSGMGKSGHIGKKISSTFASTGTPSYFVHPAEASHGDLGMIDKNDIVLLLSNSGETSELKDIISYTKRNNIKSFAITKSRNSTLGKSCDFVLELPNVKEACSLGLAPTTSTTSTLALGDCLAVCLLQEKDFGTDDFKNFHPGGKLGSQLLKASDIMINGNKLPLVNTGTMLSNALIEMENKRFGCVGVVDDNDLIGIFTDGDLLRNISIDIKSKKIDDIMTKNPITVNTHTIGSEILAIMQEKNISAVFVVENKSVLGLVHFHDLLKSGVA
ncbi:KpsF/GutQ family sugar-phosphate isomerase [Alphaproteobacteria bacterium]|nr:KpsF/GutQ family sugar-phosphate isomerase [Alphaproteobacteria bacterium]